MCSVGHVMAVVGYCFVYVGTSLVMESVVTQYALCPRAKRYMLTE